ncbi:MORN repeat-containing protein 3-like isoform X2 [Pollicipes pollicipes]|uniref:MORN repeat-containing protein 3-like isoform X2 n=1 Tax=Pollicipes pollicipes TaxID=41117 RepID=UPI001884E869|nr:MORN repeat-containing protein 3-like isoform X2 [Pollicipes pollicipes]
MKNKGAFLDITNDEKAKKNGTRAKIFLKNGTYKGDWNNDLKHGKGVFEWKSGAIYSGDWAWDHRHGHGVYTELCPNTCQMIQYNGQWCCDRREGDGAQFYPDGESYEGEWRRDRRHGWGRMFYKDGSLYEGGWSLGVREGRGLLRKVLRDVQQELLCGPARRTAEASLRPCEMYSRSFFCDSCSCWSRWPCCGTPPPSLCRSSPNATGSYRRRPQTAAPSRWPASTPTESPPTAR